MKRASILFSLLAAFSLDAAQSQLWNFDWKFFYGKNDAAHARDFDDSAWRKLDLPHDFQIEQPWVVPTAEELKKNGGDKNRAFKPYSQAWYRKTFTANPEWRGKRVILDFEGVMQVSDVYINGEKVASSEYGYSGFEADITKYLDYSKPNTVAVFAHVAPWFGSRWYTGGGIYRNVHLVVKDPVAVARHGLYITTPEISEKSAKVRVETEVENTLDSVRRVAVKSAIFAPNGEKIAEKTRSLRIPAKSTAKTEVFFNVKNPALWDTESPTLYSASAEVSEKGKVLDSKESNFGIRTIAFNPKQGFLLNGRKVLLKGSNLHHDLGALGAAVFDSELERRVKLLKSMGVNNIRTSHNPYTESLISLADKYGILIVDEAFDKWSKYFLGGRREADEVWPNVLSEFIKRDRNHPSVILWSLGNELDIQHGKYPNQTDKYGDYGVTMYKIKRDFCKKFDDTRPFTVGQFPARAKGIDCWQKNVTTEQWENSEPAELAFVTDVSSQNYTWGFFEKDSKKYPNMIFYQSEIATGGLAWHFYGMNLDKVVGGAYWGVIAYLGESFGWPQKGWGDKALVDTLLNIKPQGYWLCANFLEGIKPIVHISISEGKDKKDVFVEHNGVMIGLMPENENWNRQDGSTADIIVYSNAEEVELLLNGKSLGVRKNNTYQATRNSFRWDKIKYEKGELKAVAKTGGKIVGEHSLFTVEEPVKLAVELTNPDWKADGMDLQVVKISAVDKSGHVHPLASNKLTFSVEGDAKLIAVDNGDMNSNELHVGNTRLLHYGRAAAILRAGKTAGNVKFEIKCDGLPTQVVELKTK